MGIEADIQSDAERGGAIDARWTTPWKYYVEEERGGGVEGLDLLLVEGGRSFVVTSGESRWLREVEGSSEGGTEGSEIEVGE